MRERLEQLSGVLLVIALSVFIFWTDPKPEPVPTPAKDSSGEWVTIQQRQPVPEETSDVEVPVPVDGDAEAGARSGQGADGGAGGTVSDDFIPPTLLGEQLSSSPLEPEKGGDPSESRESAPSLLEDSAAAGPSDTPPAAASSYSPGAVPEPTEGYVPSVIQYSPASWHCSYCGPQHDALESIKNRPFAVQYIERDGMGTYPQVWFSTPEGNWKRFRGFTSAENIMSEWKKYHCRPSDKGTAENPGNEKYERTLSLSRLQGMNADQLRKTIREWGQPLPTNGTVVGMTVTYHLTEHHGFSPSVVSQLSESDRHRVHQLAHNLEDGRTTATVRISGQTYKQPRRRGLFRGRRR